MKWEAEKLGFLHQLPRATRETKISILHHKVSNVYFSWIDRIILGLSVFRFALRNWSTNLCCSISRFTPCHCFTNLWFGIRGLIYTPLPLASIEEIVGPIVDQLILLRPSLRYSRINLAIGWPTLHFSLVSFKVIDYPISPSQPLVLLGAVCSVFVRE